MSYRAWSQEVCEGPTWKSRLRVPLASGRSLEADLSGHHAAAWHTTSVNGAQGGWGSAHKAYGQSDWGAAQEATRPGGQARKNSAAPVSFAAPVLEILEYSVHAAAQPRKYARSELSAGGARRADPPAARVPALAPAFHGRGGLSHHPRPALRRSRTRPPARGAWASAFGEERK